MLRYKLVDFKIHICIHSGVKHYLLDDPRRNITSFKNMKNDKSPGQDGFTSDFCLLLLLWIDLGHFI